MLRSSVPTCYPESRTAREVLDYQRFIKFGTYVQNMGWFPHREGPGFGHLVADQSERDMVVIGARSKVRTLTKEDKLAEDISAVDTAAGGHVGR
jgi:hypothetical protein